MPNTNPDKISKDLIFLQKGWKSGHTAVYNLFRLPLFVIVWVGFEPLTFNPVEGGMSARPPRHSKHFVQKKNTNIIFSL